MKYIVQAVLPSYRIGFFNLLTNNYAFILVVGDEYFSPTVLSDFDNSKNVRLVSSRNFYFFNRMFLLQTWKGMFSFLKGSLRVVELNPRCIYSWIALLSSYFFGFGKTVVWGHLNNRSGKYSPKSLRGLMVRLADGCIFYTRGQADKFRSVHSNYNKPVGFAPNSVLFEKEVCPVDIVGADFCYVGRLVEEKKVMLLLDAFLLVCQKGNTESMLHIVGAGPQLSLLKRKLEGSQYQHRVVFYGQQSDPVFLKRIYEQSVCSVSPGYVGLSITQSFSFGRPMLVAKNENHSPEIEIFSETVNGYYHISDSSVDLALKMALMYENRDTWAGKSQFIASDIANNYTYERMAEGFMKVVNSIVNTN